MGKWWERQERNGNASVLRAVGQAMVAIGIIVLALWATGGLALFDTLKGF